MAFTRMHPAGTLGCARAAGAAKHQNEKSSQKPVDLLAQLCRLERLLDLSAVQPGDKRLRIFSGGPRS
jgi:hypothetical protein